MTRLQEKIKILRPVVERMLADGRTAKEIGILKGEIAQDIAEDNWFKFFP